MAQGSFQKRPLSYLIGNCVVAREECEAFFEVPLAALYYQKGGSLHVEIRRSSERGENTEPAG